MRTVVQRVTRAKVTVEDKIVGEIGNGLVVLLGIARDDTEKDAEYLVEKIAALRIFDDEAGVMNVSVKDVGGAVLIMRSVGKSPISLPLRSPRIESRRPMDWFLMGRAGAPDAEAATN